MEEEKREKGGGLVGEKEIKHDFFSSILGKWKQSIAILSNKTV